jgi:hypothetical protein
MDWLAIAERLGFPAFMALGLLYIISKASILFINDVVKPLKETHINFVNSLKIQLEQLTSSQTNLVNTLNTISKTISALEERLEELGR